MVELHSLEVGPAAAPGGWLWGGCDPPGMGKGGLIIPGGGKPADYASVLLESHQASE